MKTGRRSTGPGLRPAATDTSGFLCGQAGFTLLEVLVALVILAIGATVTMSALSGSLGNVRKAQMRTRVTEYARNIMESSLYNEKLQQPTTYSEDLDNGFHCTVFVEEYTPETGDEIVTEDRAELPVKLLQYTVEMFGPDSPDPVYRLQTLKLVNTSEELR